MNKAIKYIIILIFLSDCSLLNKDTINDEKSSNIFKKIKPIEKEFNTELRIKSLNDFNGQPFNNNSTNNNGNINYNSNFEEIKKYRFAKISNFKSHQPELFFSSGGELIFFDGKGTIIKLDQNLKEIWKTNNYNKKEKKINPILNDTEVDIKLKENKN